MTRFPGVNRVIFDLNFTLINSNTENEAQEIADLLGIKATSKFIKEVDSFFLENEKETRYRRITRDYYESLIRFMIPSLKEQGRTGTQFLEAVTNINSSLMYGAEGILEYLYSRNYVIVALTNWFANYQIQTLKKLEILKYFERVYGWDDNYSKPDKRAFIRCLDGTEPRNNIFIADSAVNDIAPAKEIGMYTIGFNIDKDKYKWKQYIPDEYITNLIEIKDIL